MSPMGAKKRLPFVCQKLGDIKSSQIELKMHQSTQRNELRRLVCFQLDLSLGNRQKSNFSKFFGAKSLEKV